MNWVSLVLAGILMLITWRAYRNGFIRELVSLSAAILAVPLAGLFYDDMVPKVEPIVDNVNLARLLSFLAIFGGVLVGGQVAAHMLKRAVNLLNLGVLDQFAGALFGFAKAYLICQVLLIALVVFPSPDFTDDIDASPVATLLLDSSPPLLAILPERFDTTLDRFLDGITGEDVGPGGGTPTPPPQGTPTP